MDEQRAAAERLVPIVFDYCLRGDLQGLADQLREQWSPECLCPFLNDADSRVRRAAALGLGLIGDTSVAEPLAKLLHDEDEPVAEAAEDALWSVWFRQGGAAACNALTRIAGSVEEGDVENAVPVLTALVRSMPTYAEAYHQRSQVHYLENNYTSALRDAARAYELNPRHFSALAMQAHCLAALGRFGESLQAYRKALTLHPRMPGVRAAIHQLRARLAPHAQSNDAAAPI